VIYFYLNLLRILLTFYRNNHFRLYPCLPENKSMLIYHPLLFSASSLFPVFKPFISLNLLNIRSQYLRLPMVYQFQYLQLLKRRSSWFHSKI
jgi:hypothetical protein